MTKPHRATPDDWAQQEDWANRSAFSDSSCIIELRDRIEALEIAQQPPLFTAEEVARIVAPSSPASSLVERVLQKVLDTPSPAPLSISPNQIRAAIREVAAWLTENYARDVASPPPCQVKREYRSYFITSPMREHFFGENATTAGLI